jgi:hypothetical protein
MTPSQQSAPQQVKGYCDHWVVCKHAHALLYCPVDATGEHHKECEYDTRSRSLPAAPDNIWSADTKKGCEPCKNTECNYCAMRSENIKDHDAAIAAQARADVLEEMFPPNTKINSNGDLDGGWELDPAPLFNLQRAIEKNPQFTEEPCAEVIETVILAIKQSLRQPKEEQK